MSFSSEKGFCCVQISTDADCPIFDENKAMMTTSMLGMHTQHQNYTKPFFFSQRRGYFM